jgi:hypothetical protein
MITRRDTYNYSEQKAIVSSLPLFYFYGIVYSAIYHFKRTTMKKIILLFSVIVGCATLFVFCSPAMPIPKDPVKNIVLVHGAFADGSGFQPSPALHGSPKRIGI